MAESSTSGRRTASSGGVSGQEFVMQDLKLIGVQDDGQHLLLSGPDGTHYRLALDEALRAAARHDRPRLGQLQIEMEGGMRPREVQSLIRAGATAEEVADRAGWTVEKVRRYEGPILAERVHVADQARLVRVRSRGGSAGATVPTLQGRVAQRMRERGVDPETNVWDAWRSAEDTHWTVVLTFAAGGRQRQATWTYDPVLRTVEAADDEARWLSADEPAAVGPLPTVAPRVSSVYDVEAEGGVAATRRAGSTGRAPRDEEPVDLMTAMRQRTTVGRRSGRRRAAGEPVRREVAPALPLGGDAAVEAPVSGAPPVTEAPEAPGPSVEAVDVTDVVEETHDVELEPAGAETPPLHDAWAEPLDDAGEAAEEVAVTEVAHGEEPVPADQALDLAVEKEAVPEESGGETAAASGDDEPPGTDETATTKKTASRRKQRPSVPSWDDIMFGTKRE
jgi:hypothetical protein